VAGGLAAWAFPGHRKHQQQVGGQVVSRWNEVGKLTALQPQGRRKDGGWPTATVLLVAVVKLAIDPQTGELMPPQHQICLSRPRLIWRFSFPAWKLGSQEVIPQLSESRGRNGGIKENGFVGDRRENYLFLAAMREKRVSDLLGLLIPDFSSKRRSPGPACHTASSTGSPHGNAEPAHTGTDRARKKE